MKIVQIMPEFGLGGAETMCANLAIELARKGYEVIVISLYNTHTSITENLEKNKIKVLYLNKKSGLSASIIFKIKAIFKEIKPDVVHTHLYAAKYAQIAAWLSGVKCRVHTIHNIASKDGGRLEQRINRFLIKHLHVIPVSLSDIIQETVVKTYNIPKEKSPVVFNGVPLEKCVQHKKYEVAKKFIHIGRFTEQKNHLMLIKAFVKAHEQVDDIELYLYGCGELQNEAKEISQKLNALKYIHFCGTTDNVYNVLNDADCFILPSKWEGIPMTLIEAMGSALPIIASKVGGVENMLVNEKSAILINPVENEIIEAILKLYNNIELCKKIGQEALCESKKFSAENMAEAYSNIYRKELK